MAFGTAYIRDLSELKCTLPSFWIHRDSSFRETITNIQSVIFSAFAEPTTETLFTLQRLYFLILRKRILGQLDEPASVRRFEETGILHHPLIGRRAEVEVAAREADDDIHAVLALPNAKGDARPEAVREGIAVGFAVGKDVSEFCRELLALVLAASQYRVAAHCRITGLDGRCVGPIDVTIDAEDFDLRGPGEYAGGADIEAAFATTAEEE